jgi:DNA-directed RNA polymerase specialized sigma24 family protein
MSYAEVASTLHRSVGTIKSQYSRGKKKLQTLDHEDGLQRTSHQELAETIPLRPNHINQLDDHLREVVELHYIQGLSYAEIAQKLGRPKGTVKGWISRAMKNLQQYVYPQSISKTTQYPSRKRSNLTGDEPEYIGWVTGEETTS